MPNTLRESQCSDAQWEAKMISPDPQGCGLRPLGSWSWCQKGSQVKRQRHLLEHCAFFSSHFPIFSE